MWGDLILIVFIGVCIILILTLILIALPFIIYAKKTNHKKMRNIIIAILIITAVLFVTGLITDIIPLQQVASLLSLLYRI